MKLKDLTAELDRIFEIDLALPGDATGLQTGRADSDIKTILITLDITEPVVDEAISLKADLVISHHPLIFDPITKITGDSMQSLKIIKLVENRIAAYTAHTNFDSATGGLNDHIAGRIGLKNIKIMEKSLQQWYKFTIFVPVEAESEIRDAICRSGGGRLGNYSCCTFNIKGTGTFKPLNGANPYSGSIGKLSFADEVRIECVVSQNDLEKLVREVVKKHPYEEPAYDIYKIENRLSQAGIGRSGEVDPPVRFEGFIETIKEKLGIGNIRWMASDRESTDKSITGKTIRKVAVINGSAGSFSERFFKSTENQYDMIITGEIKHHSAIKLIESGIILVELGHAESEKFFTELVFARLSAGLKKFEKFKLIKGKTGFIPWRYCIE